MKPMTFIPEREWRRQEGKHNLRIYEEKVKGVTYVCNILLNSNAIGSPWKNSSFKRRQPSALEPPSMQLQHLPMTHFHLRKLKAAQNDRAEWTRAMWTGHQPPETTLLVSKWKQIPLTFVSVSKRFHNWHRLLI
jgi:hypothetical protein